MPYGKSVLLFLLAASAGLGATARNAHADTVSAVGGLAVSSTSAQSAVELPSPLIGTEYTLDLGSHLQLGGFYDHNFLSYSGGAHGALRYLGGVGRAYLNDAAASGPFVFAKAGLAEKSRELEVSNRKPAFGAGAGYQIVLSPVVSFDPRMSVRSLPEAPVEGAGSQPVFDLSFVVSFRF
jgi:hypothetical protein